MHYILTTINSCKKYNLRAKINDGALVIECLKNKKQSDFFLFFTFTTYFPSFFQFWRTFRSLTTKVFTKTPESVWILWTKKVTLLSSHYTYNLHDKLHWKRLSITHTHCGLGAVTKFCSFVRNNSWDISLLWRREPAWVYRANQKAVLSPSLPRRILVHRVINSSRPRDITRLRGGIHRMVSSHHWKKEKTLLIMVIGPSGVQFCVWLTNDWQNWTTAQRESNLSTTNMTTNRTERHKVLI